MSNRSLPPHSTAVSRASGDARPATQRVIRTAVRNIVDGWIADADMARPSVAYCENDGDRRAQAFRLEIRLIPNKPTKESEHLRSLARGCQEVAKETSDAEMAQLFRDIGADYYKRAMRLTLVGR